ncbi:MAG: sigma-54-dependent Fis family transcriptional regulator [Myxococcales bacterium]|nr:sigma-54-dependent Fis family transcriptional regulator [Myxococcales bacterium]
MSTATKVLICDDEELVRWSIGEYLRSAGMAVAEASNGQEFLASVDAEGPSVAILDLNMPVVDGMTALRTLRERGNELPVIMLTAVGSVEPVVEATRLGAASYLTKPFELADVKRAVVDALAAHRARTSIAAPVGEGYAGIIGRSPAMRRVFETLQQLEGVDTPSVLLTGESGTGKDVIAQAIHRRGSRGPHPFVEVDCTAIPETLMESTLFGHERGAFTDAKVTKRGLFEEAGRGIVFLDEIGELAAGLQAKLLRALENRTFKRVGGNQNLRLDAAVVAATNRDLRAEVDRGRFRKDLYYRLAVVELHVPALRHRPEDIPLLVQHFIEVNNTTLGKSVAGVTEEAIGYLQSYSWPGNVRELRNVVERMMLFATESVIDATRLPPAIRFASAAGGEGCPFVLPEGGIDLESVERGFVVQALERTNDNQTAAAKLLGLSRYALRNRMKKFDLM